MSECETATGQRGRQSWLTQWRLWVCNLDVMTELNTSPCPLCHLARLPCISAILHSHEGPPQRCLWLLSPQGVATSASSHTCGVVLIFWPTLLFLPARWTWYWPLSHVLNFRTDDSSKFFIKTSGITTLLFPHPPA